MFGVNKPNVREQIDSEMGNKSLAGRWKIHMSIKDLYGKQFGTGLKLNDVITAECWWAWLETPSRWHRTYKKIILNGFP